MQSHRIVLLLSLLFLTGTRCFGFGNDGHRIVGAIAETYLTDEAKTEIQTLADVATWADEIRGNPRYFFAKPLHFVGDVHQPLHVSYTDDQGGNKVKVFWFGAADWSLHSVWDTAFVTKRKGLKSWKQLAGDLRAGIGAAERAGWSGNTDPVGWANESLQFTRTIYAELPADHRLDLDYYQKYVGRFEKQLTAAGVRLARLLNDTLAAPMQPVAEAAPAAIPLSI